MFLKLRACFAALALAAGLTGCGDSKTDSKQPKLQGSPDQKQQGMGPAPLPQPGGGPAKGGAQAGIQ